MAWIEGNQKRRKQFKGINEEILVEVRYFGIYF